MFPGCIEKGRAVRDGRRGRAPAWAGQRQLFEDGTPCSEPLGEEIPPAKAKDVEGDEGGRSRDPAQETTIADGLEVGPAGAVEDDQLAVEDGIG